MVPFTHLRSYAKSMSLLGGGRGVGRKSDNNCFKWRHLLFSEWHRGRGPENSNYGSDILSAWPLTIWVSGQTIFGYAFSSWNGALLTPARIGNLAYHNRHPNTYPSLSFESRCASTGKMGELVRHLNPNYTYLRIIVDMFKMLKSKWPKNYFLALWIIEKCVFKIFERSYMTW